VALVIRCPAYGNAAGEPDIAIVVIIVPVIILIQIFVPDDVIGDIRRGARLIVAVIAIVGPVIELVGSAKVKHFGVQRIPLWLLKSQSKALARASRSTSEAFSGIFVITVFLFGARMLTPHFVN